MTKLTLFNRLVMPKYYVNTTTKSTKKDVCGCLQNGIANTLDGSLQMKKR